MLAIVDLKVSNIQSVLGAFSRVGAEIRLVTRPQDLGGATAIILPGVGAFGDGMASLGEQGLIEPLHRQAAERSTPILGICLGMQLLAESSEEHGSHAGLGILPGRVVHLRPSEPGLRVPNMGWCDVKVAARNPLFPTVAPARAFYFAHSYHLECADPAHVCATIEYGGAVTAAVNHRNVFGIQFHPERSQEAGLDLLEAFCRHVGALAAAQG